VQEIFDAAESSRFGADRLDQPFRPRVDPTLGGAFAAGGGEKRRRQFLVGLSKWRLKGREPGIGRSIYPPPRDRGRGSAH
jgi:hypothetical protein